LLATRLASRIRTTLGTELPLRTLFEAPTPAALARHLDPGALVRPPVVAVSEGRAQVPLSFAQQRLWFLGQLEGPNATYNIPAAVRLSGTVDQEALTAALRDVIDRHQVLRTALSLVDGQPVQRVLPIEDVSVGLTVEQVDDEEELAAAVRRSAGQPFDLATELPLRASFFTLTPEQSVLLLTVHHIAGDGWSLAPLGRDLSAAYAARVNGRAPAWAPLPVQYADYTLWQRELLGSEEDTEGLLARQLGYWREALADIPEELALPFDRSRPAVATYRGGDVELSVPAELHADLLKLARDHGATSAMVLQAALGVLLSRLGAGEDVPIGTPVAGRTDEALDELVGFFVNTLVLRTDLSGDPTFAELLGRVREAALGAFAHQDVPFERLVEELAPARSMARHPLFQVMLSLQNNERATVELPGLDADVYAAGPAAAKFDLQFDAVEQGEGLAVRITYAADLFDAASVRTIGERWLRVLATVAGDPSLRVSAIDVLADDERHLLLQDWSGATHSVPTETVLPALFEAQAARTPDAVAVIHGDEQVTYRELNERANRLAHLLAEQGVRPESLVAIRMERTAHLMTALLAVLKAGGAYLPIDPDYPTDRVTHMLTDANPALLLTTSTTTGVGTTDVDTSGVSASAVSASAVAPQPPTVLLDRVVLDAYATTNPVVTALPAHPAYVIYTSGSTGRPKGVVITHRNITKLLTWAADTFGDHHFT
ncbi:MULTISPECIES: condensation domain-containing protein, partial [unclassified Kitasatospora]|uniref:condensation domain-containing protein n=1 Tax=unclassified Kitasatospora TaxID=2633591 RepID=UPI0033DCD86E